MNGKTQQMLFLKSRKADSLCPMAVSNERDMTSKAETFSLRLPAALKDQIDQLVRDTDASPASVIAAALASYGRENDRLKALTSAMVSAETGILHSGEQVFGWMRSWGSENELPSPEPDIRPATE